MSWGSGDSERIVQVDEPPVATTTAEPDDPGVEAAMAEAGEVWAAPEREMRKKASFGRAVNGWVGIGLVGIGVVASAALPVYVLIQAIRFVF